MYIFQYFPLFIADSSDDIITDTKRQDYCVKQRCQSSINTVGNQFNGVLSNEQRAKQQNRVWQLALKAREKMPKDYASFCLVAEHFVKNAHRYWDIEKQIQSSTAAKTEITTNDLNADDRVKLCNKYLREICTLKRLNRLHEQQKSVKTIKNVYGSYRSISNISGVPLKTVHSWCSLPKARQHKSTMKSDLRKTDFVNFLMQNTVSYSTSCKKYAGKCFLLYTLNETYKMYL